MVYQLANQIKTDINTALANTFIITYDRYTNKITIVFSSHLQCWSRKDELISTSTIALNISFGAVSASNTTHTSTNEMDLYYLIM